MPVKNSVVMPCDSCGKGIERTPWQIKNCKNHFCNRKCKAEWHKKNLSNRVSVPCDHCGKIIERTPYYIKILAHHFCDRQCNAAWLEKQTGSLSPHYNSVAVKCEQCGKEIQKPPGRLRRQKRAFCDRDCHYEYKKSITGEKASNWKGGAAKFYGPNWRKQSRAARKRDGYCCQSCGKSQAELGRALDVHHITPFKSFQYVPGENDNYIQANRLDNLISLCMRCHALVEIGKLSLPA